MSFCKSSALSLIIAATVLSGCSSLKSKKADEPVQSGAVTPSQTNTPTASGDSQATASATSATDRLQGNGMEDDAADTASGTGNGKASKGKKPGKNKAPGSGAYAGSDNGGSGAAGGKLLGQLSSVSNTIFFAFNDYSLSEDDRAVLNELAARLKNEPTLKVELYGHADERGTVNYNLALGERRGNAVEAYLRTIGVDAARVEVISYGETKPLDDGHDEDAWAHNRRVEIVITR